MSSTKKLDRALLAAIKAAQPVPSTMDRETGKGYTTCAATLSEGRRALHEAGLVLYPLGWERDRFTNRECLVRVLVLRHVESGQSQVLRSPPWALDPGGNAGGLATKSIKYMVRDLLMLPTEEPSAAVDIDTETAADTGTVRQTFERPDTETSVKADIGALLLSQPDGVAAIVNGEVVASTGCLSRLIEIRDALLEDNVQAAGEGSGSSPLSSPTEPPADLGDPDVDLALGLIGDMAEGGGVEEVSPCSEPPPPEAPKPKKRRRKKKAEPEEAKRSQISGEIVEEPAPVAAPTGDDWLEDNEL